MDNRRILNDRRITRDEVLSSLVNLRQLTFEVTDACNLHASIAGTATYISGTTNAKRNFWHSNKAGSFSIISCLCGAHVQHILPHRELISVFMAENR